MQINIKILSIFILALVSALMMSNFVAAEDNFKAMTDINFKGGCTVNGTYCSDSTSCNITAFYPNGELYINNKPMTNQITYYNITLEKTNTMGEYSGKITCYDPEYGFSGTEEFVFLVTPTGVEQQSIMNNAIQIILILIAIALLVLGYAMKSYPIGFISACMWMAGGVYILIYGFNNYTDGYTRGLGIVLCGIGFIIAMVAGYEGVKDGEDEDEEVKEEVDEHDYFKQ